MALFEVAKPRHGLCGSNDPNAPESGIDVFAVMLEKYEGVRGGTNAVRKWATLELLPHLKQYYDLRGGTQSRWFNVGSKRYELSHSLHDVSKGASQEMGQPNPQDWP